MSEFITVLLGMTLVCLGVPICLALVSLVNRDLAHVLASFTLLGTYLGMFAISIWVIVIAFSDSVIHGLLCLFVPFYQWFYIATHWEECQGLFLAYVGSIVILFGTALVTLI